ncbi:MAG TPA: glycosyltransferase [Ktedonobacterales bacterium]|nr:glycosyltransferase [Ktedonobacterales bacterium]
MHIALLAPLVAPIAPPFLGGAQALLYDLAAGLVRRGHAVALYAADGSSAPGVRVVPLGIDSSRLQPASFSEAPRVRNVMESDADEYGQAASEAFLHTYRILNAHASEHDLLHAHAYDWEAYAYAAMQPLPTVHTLHLPPVDARINATLATIAPSDTPAPLLASGATPRLVTVSQACAATYASICRIDAVIYNGIAVERIPFGARPEEPRYLLYAGRITPEKGVEDALEIAARAGRKLILAGGIYDEEYFAERIGPRLETLGNAASYIGSVTRERLWALMAGAEAVLCPVQWEEPFGLVACEAQAAGTPVVGYARGGLREVVADGETGWLTSTDDLDGAVQAVLRVDQVDRAACRARVERLFSLDAMLSAYEAFYARCLAG